MDYWITCKQGHTNYITDYILPSISVHINLQYAWGNNATFNEAMLHTFGILTELKAEIKKIMCYFQWNITFKGAVFSIIIARNCKKKYCRL